jgi:signal transduction histidine kinase
MSIRYKFLIVLAVMTLVIAGLLAVMYRATQETRERYGELSGSAMPITRALAEVRFSGSQIDAASLAYLAAARENLAQNTGTPAFNPDTTFDRVDMLRSELERAVVDLDIAIGEYSRLASTEVTHLASQDQNEQERQSLVAAGEDYINAAVAIARMPATALAGAEPRWQGRTLRDLKWALLATANHAIDNRARELAAASDSVAEQLDRTVRYAVIFAIFAICIAVVCNYLLTGRIAKPIMKLRDIAAKVGKGDFAAAAELEGVRRNDEVGQLVTSFRQMAGELESATSKLTRQERLAMLGQLAGTVSHELRNPLSAIRNSMALVRQVVNGKNLGLEKALDRVDRNIERCSRIIGDLLEFTRVRELAREATAIDDWLVEMLDEHAVSPEVVVTRDLRFAGEAAIDRHRFRQVIVNLVDNAAQALTDASWQPPAGQERRITVRSEAAGPYLKLSVVDTGCGIAADKLGRIFEPLFTTKSFGVGLGLPTVRQIIEQHGGTIDVESAVDQGTTFTIWLPRQPSQPASVPVAASPAKEQAA